MHAIRRRLNELGKTQTELAEVLNVSNATVSRFMNDGRVIEGIESPRVAAFLEWSVEALRNALNPSADDYDRWMATRLKQLGKTRAGLARALDLPKPHARGIVRGLRRVRFNDLPAISNYLDMPEEQLFSLIGGEAGARSTLINDGLDGEAERYNEQFRQRLVEVRDGLGWSQARMASSLGLPLERYKKYETRSHARRLRCIYCHAWHTFPVVRFRGCSLDTAKTTKQELFTLDPEFAPTTPRA